MDWVEREFEDAPKHPARIRDEFHGYPLWMRLTLALLKGVADLRLRICSDLRELVRVAYDWNGVRTRRIKVLKLAISVVITCAALIVPAAILLGSTH